MGDSITRGIESFSWVERLQRRHPDYRIGNFGRDGDLAENVWNRIPHILQFQPARIILLVGTNDINARLGERNGKRYRMMKGLEAEPSLESYVLHLHWIVDSFLESAEPRDLALCSLPPIGEIPTESGYRLAREYSREVERCASGRGLAYLPLNEALCEAIDESELDPVPYRGSLGFVAKTLVRRFAKFESMAAISESYGFRVLLDGLHLNETGGNILLDLADGFLRGEAGAGEEATAEVGE